MGEDRNRDAFKDLLDETVLNRIYRNGLLHEGQGDEFDPEHRNERADWPKDAHTMIGAHRPANIRLVIETVLAENIEGAFIETGIWCGGAYNSDRVV